MIWKEFARMKFHELRECSDSLESYLVSEGNRMKSEAQKRASEMSESDRQEYYEFAADDFYQFENTFPQILRYSLFTRTYSLFEYMLSCYAESLEHPLKLNLTPKDLSGKGVDQIKNYLTKVVRLSWPEAEWRDILAMRRVRNLITHVGGFYQHTDQQLESLIKKWTPDLSTNNLHQLQLSGKFVLLAIDAFDQFFNELTESTKAVALR